MPAPSIPLKPTIWLPDEMGKRHIENLKNGWKKIMDEKKDQETKSSEVFQH